MKSVKIFCVFIFLVFDKFLLNQWFKDIFDSKHAHEKKKKRLMLKFDFILEKWDIFT